MSARKLYENSTPLPDPRSGLVLDDFMLTGVFQRFVHGNCLEDWFGMLRFPLGLLREKLEFDIVFLT